MTQIELVTILINFLSYQYVQPLSTSKDNATIILQLRSETYHYAQVVLYYARD